MTLVSCISVVDDVNIECVYRSIESFHDQTYRHKQLIIINNTANKIETLYSNDVIIVDRHSWSTGKCLQFASEISDGQIIAYHPLNYIHHHNRLSYCVDNLVENFVISTDRYLLHDGTEIVENVNSMVPELTIMRSPAFYSYHDVNHGAWWSYILHATKCDIPIINLEKSLSTKLC